MNRIVKYTLKTYGVKPLQNMYWRLYGIGVNHRALPAGPKAFLFICKGNVCRSVFAQFYAEKTARGNGASGLRFESAGLDVIRAAPPPKEAHRVAEKYDVHFKDHLSKSIHKKMVQSHDMVIAMEAWQLKYLARQFPESTNKFFLLPIFDRNPALHPDRRSRYNIDDPFDGDLSRFASCYEHIAKCIRDLFQRINVAIGE